ncbi:MAG: hypothetical protein WD119_01860 [Pirellulaceae bacterium]
MFDFTAQRPQLMMLAGIILLGWVLMRRQMKARKRSWREDRQQHKAMGKLARQETHAVPLAGAPVETLRWQAELFDLQRELKAELETKIAVVQTLLRQVDQRIERLEAHSGGHPLTPEQSRQVKEMSSAGFSVTDIADRLGLPQGDVEWVLSMQRH